MLGLSRTSCEDADRCELCKGLPRVRLTEPFPIAGALDISSCHVEMVLFKLFVKDFVAILSASIFKLRRSCCGDNAGLRPPTAGFDMVAGLDTTDVSSVAPPVLTSIIFDA
jgi:hypothetical protein